MTFVRGWAVLVASATAFVGCASNPEVARTTSVPSQELSPEPDAPVRNFRYMGLSGAVVDGVRFRGRMTLVAMIATYDTASQAQVRFLKSVLRHHAPRINVVVIVLEPAHHRPMVEAFAATLELPYPVAMADEVTIAGRGPFDGLHHVPSGVLLDRDGRERWRNIGLIEPRELREAIARYDDQRDKAR